MKTNTRCKFKCESIHSTQHNATVVLQAVHDSGINKEDHAFFTATPNGTFSMTVCPADRADYFTPGKFYYLDISEVEEVSVAG